MDLLVNIDVDDLDRAVQFYTEAFGWRVGRRFGADGAELLGASSPVYLLRKPAGTQAALAAPEALRDYQRHWTPVHLDVVVTDVHAAAARAVTAGATLEARVRESSWGKLAAMADPFGNGFCLVQFVGRGYDEVATPAAAAAGAACGCGEPP